MFRFKNFDNCEFNVTRDLFGNVCINLYDVEKEILIYEVTQSLPYPVAEGIVALKESKYLYQFLAELQKQGIVIGSLKKQPLPDGRTVEFGMLECSGARMAAASY